MTTHTLVCVLRSGGEYTPAHVRCLYQTVTRHWPIDGPALKFVALTDVRIDMPGICEVPLRADWPGWWAKLELCRPDLVGSFLYCDLDTIVVRDPTTLWSVNDVTVLRDFYHRNLPTRQHLIGSGLMFMTDDARAAVWTAWQRSPLRAMTLHRARGDQAFLETVWGTSPAKWQDVLPHAVCSYKVDVRRQSDRVPDGARIVCFHGQPRPWHTAFGQQHYAVARDVSV